MRDGRETAMTRTILPPIDEADGVLDELQAWFLARADVDPDRWREQR
jgi:hypothetical protein